MLNMSVKFNPVDEFEIHKLRVCMASRFKHNTVGADMETEAIMLPMALTFTGGVKRQISIVEYIISKIYLATTTSVRHITFDGKNTSEILYGGAVIMSNNQQLIRSVVANFTIKYIKLRGKPTKIYTLTHIMLS